MPHTVRLEWLSYFSKFLLYIRKEGNEIMMEEGANVYPVVGELSLCSDKQHVLCQTVNRETSC